MDAMAVEAGAVAVLEADAEPPDADCPAPVLDSDVASVVAVDVTVDPLKGVDDEVAVAVALVIFVNPLRMMEVPPADVLMADNVTFGRGFPVGRGTPDTIPDRERVASGVIESVTLKIAQISSIAAKAAILRMSV